MNAAYAAFASTGLTTLLPVATVYFVGNRFESYGYGLFVATPLALGMFAGLLHNLGEPRRPLQSAAAGVLLLFAWEGAICVAMVLPGGLLLAVIGGFIGHGLSRLRRRVAVAMMLPLVAPGVAVVEKGAGLAPPLYEVVTSVTIAAPPEEVWPQVIAFPPIPAPEEWYFRRGIASPLRARIEGSGSGAIRYCEFSTGAFVEPIEVWEANRLLEFGVTRNPPPMKEWNPFATAAPPHLHGFLTAKRGRFRLTRLAEGGTRLEGTTWYEHGLWPAEYWRWWSDAIIHRIHLRVLNHIKAVAERS